MRKTLIPALTCSFLSSILFPADQSHLTTTRVFIMLGPPGSGKSTQSLFLSKKYKIPAISAASVLKREMQRKAAIAGMEAGVESGELLGNDALNELMKTRLLAPDAGKGFILDGYPETAEQARFLDAFLKEHSFPPPKVVFLEAPDDVVTKRMLLRHRADDQPDNIARRLEEFHAEVELLTGWYKSANMMRVDGTKTVPEVSAEIDALLEQALANKPLKIR